MLFTSPIKYSSLFPISTSFIQCVSKPAFEVTHVVHLKNLVLSLVCLKYHIGLKFNVLSCISGVDHLGTKISNKYRFCVVYDLLSTIFNERTRIKVFLNEISLLSSVTDIYVNANWWEREVWDMFGIWFENHPDLRRILTDYGFDGFPLRKDFPLVGYVEVTYDLKKKRIISKPCEFSQEFRYFVFENSWI